MLFWKYLSTIFFLHLSKVFYAVFYFLLVQFPGLTNYVSDLFGFLASLPIFVVNNFLIIWLIFWKLSYIKCQILLFGCLFAGILRDQMCLPLLQFLISSSPWTLYLCYNWGEVKLLWLSQSYTRLLLICDENGKRIISVFINQHILELKEICELLSIISSDQVVYK